MREVCLKSQRIKKILSGITDAVYNPENLEKIVKSYIEKKDNLITEYSSVDDRYFKKAFKEYPIKEYSFPRAAKFTGTMSTNKDHGDPFFFDLVNKKVLRLQNTLGAPQNALCVLYPDDGYIGWHHNGNAPGYNILFSYSQDGDGYFKYYDREKDEVIYMQDNPGWNVKCGYYPYEKTEPNRVYWHAAATKKARMSIAFVIPNRDIWINVIEYITDGDYDEDYLKSQGAFHELKKEGYV